MNAQEIIEYIRTSEKKTPVKVYVWEKTPVAFPGCHEFPAGEGCKIVFGDWKQVAPVLESNEFAHFRAILADLDAEGPLSHGGKESGRGEILLEAGTEAEAFHTGAGKDDGVVLAFLHLAEAGLHIAAKHGHFEIGAQGQRLGLTAQ